jgi:hypothetical protein
LSELVNSGDQHRWRTPINLFIHNQQGQAFIGGFAPRVFALAQRITTVDERPGSPRGVLLDRYMLTGVNGGTAPRTIGELMWGPYTEDWTLSTP